ncbi:UDP-glucose 4-epimerase [Sedimentisphaera cyanobacteriorum]|uniref:UDP-glucose 4-epimerase n=1 Tax=Sedimentisphaera cyanobacteriorum TaxID=1940790 RepID=A0A1Q2HPE7_9BACT|nr:SDR family NAD(P)-dependent oxidoreductase [Sedimentisphaera cyanobacteriorum]AQQ09154.1 UDP-glucose 4-epimerase [Sedimentisphaera cyanobacteriorum]
MKRLEGKTVLITGGTGSFGKTVTNTLLETGCKEIRIFSRDELKQELMRIEKASSKLRFYIGDVRDRESVDEAMNGVDLVFHAAALKQVPSCEFFPMQAVMTNISGSNNVIQSAIKHGVDKVVCLSTDKAVYPINSMGMTKALMEKVSAAASRLDNSGDTTVCRVRYGNVMCSRGSVIPLFMNQIKQGQPLTLTVPDMTRFMLPLRDAVSLVLFAFENGCPGDLFVRKAPACTMMDLAKAVRNIMNADNEIKVIGIRHGEKIYESLLTVEELQKAEDMVDYYRVGVDDRDLNYTMYFSEGKEKEVVNQDYNSHNTRQMGIPEVEKLLLSLPYVQKELEVWEQRQ